MKRFLAIGLILALAVAGPAAGAQVVSSPKVDGSSITATADGTLSASGGGSGCLVSGATGIVYNTGSSTCGTITGTDGQLVVFQTGATPLAKTLSGDGTLSAGGAITITKTSGASFAASATTDTTNASNISSGSLAAARMTAMTATVGGAVPTPPNNTTTFLRGDATFVAPAFSNLTGNITAAQSLALTSGHLYVGNGSNLPADVALSGDCTLANTGAVTCTKTNGTSFAASATTDTTNASNISSGSLPLAQIGASAASHAVPVDVAGTSTYKVVPDCTDSGGNHLNYTQSTDAFACGTSSSGGGGGGAVSKLATSNTDYTSNTTLGTINGMTLALTAGKSYVCNGMILESGSSAGGTKIALSNADTLTITSMAFTLYDYGSVNSTVTTLGTAATNTANLTAWVINAGIVVNAAGTLAVQAAQNTSNATKLTILANSNFTCNQV